MIQTKTDIDRWQHIQLRCKTRKRNWTVCYKQKGREQIEKLPYRPGIVSLISLTGAFNVAEWKSIITEKPEAAISASLEQLKDMALVAEGAQAGAGANLQQLILDIKFIDEGELKRVETERVRESAHILLKTVPIALQLNSYLQFGKNINQLTSKEKEISERYGIITDFGHFSRIMQKDIVDDDVKRIWQVKKVGLAFERNLNAAYTHREQTLYPVPVKMDTEVAQRIGETEQNEQGQTTMITAERIHAPNVCFGMAITHPENFISLLAYQHEGKGEMHEKTITSTSELLKYLSYQFENLMASYPLEKVALIFDKFLFKIGVENLGIQMAAVQTIKTEAGEARSKILQVGNIGAMVVKQNRESKHQDIISKLKTGNVSNEELMKIATRLILGFVAETISVTPKQRQRIIGQITTALKNESISIIPFVEEAQEEALGSIIQASHRITEIPVDANDSVVFIPPIISSVIAHEPIETNYKNRDNLLSRLNSIKKEKSRTSFGFHKLITQETQVHRDITWTEESIFSQLEDFFNFMVGLKKEYAEVFAHLQFSHIHPTAPKHSSIQEQGATIAGTIGRFFRENGIETNGSSLIDEYHTDDLMMSYQKFEEMLQSRAGGIFTELMNESSPVMRLVGDAVVRAIMADSRTEVRGDTIIHKAPGKTVEVWDNISARPRGGFTIGRQACVPFNIGMDISMMVPEMADGLYKKYLQARYPETTLARLVGENPDMSIHQIFTRFIMSEPNIEKRNNIRHRVLDEIDRSTFNEVSEVSPDISAFDLVVLDEMYHKIRLDMETKKRIPIVIHVLESNYNAQQEKAGYIWNLLGFMAIPVFRVSFDPESHKIQLLTSIPPDEDRIGNFLESNRETIDVIKSNLIQ